MVYLEAHGSPATTYDWAYNPAHCWDSLHKACYEVRLGV